VEAGFCQHGEILSEGGGKIAKKVSENSLLVAPPVLCVRDDRVAPGFGRGWW